MANEISDCILILMKKNRLFFTANENVCILYTFLVTKKRLVNVSNGMGLFTATFDFHLNY